MSSPLDIARFNRICSLVALGWLTLIVLVSFLIRPTDQDFRQYYMGALMARHGDWSALYPRVRPGSVYNAAYPEQADSAQAYIDRAREVGIPPEGYRFIQPPIDAVLFLPLAWLPYHAAFALWTALLVLAMWGISVQAGKTFNLAAGRPAPGAGVATLIVAFSVLAYRAVRVGNLSPMIGYSLGAVTISLAGRRSIAGGLALWFGAVTKYATLALLPLVVAMRRWRLVVIAAAILLVSVLLTLAIAGVGPFVVFFRDIAPTLGRPHPTRANQSLAGFLLRVAGEPMPTLVSVALSLAKWISLLILLALVFTRSAHFWKRPAHVLAASCALICWMLIFSPIYWEHYPVYLCPFWGWLLWEAGRSRMWFLGSCFVIVTMWFPLQALPRFTYPEPLNSHILWGTIALLGLACSKLAGNRAR